MATENKNENESAQKVSAASKLAAKTAASWDTPGNKKALEVLNASAKRKLK